MIIHRIRNNIITLDEDEQECAVCGKGIAFKKKVGDKIIVSRLIKFLF